MRKVMQSRLYTEDGLHNGNCLAACLASLLNLPLWMVPPFEEMFGRRTDNYLDRVDEWLRCLFRKELVRRGGHSVEELPDEYIACGPSPRGVYHAVIYSKGELIHDPHYSGAGIAEVQFTYHLASHG